MKQLILICFVFSFVNLFGQRKYSLELSNNYTDVEVITDQGNVGILHDITNDSENEKLRLKFPNENYPPIQISFFQKTDLGSLKLRRVRGIDVGFTNLNSTLSNGNFGSVENSFFGRFNESFLEVDINSLKSIIGNDNSCIITLVFSGNE